MSNDLLIVKAGVDSQMFNLIRAQAAARSSKTLLMAVGTPGGDPMYAYRTMVFLRSIYKKIVFIVFDEAMSAGTLMALGANCIYLEEGACLGPLDLQIPHPRDDSRISTLDVRDTATSTVFEASNVMLKLCEKNLKAGLPMTIAMDASVKMATDLYKPIMDKIDPFHLHESYRNAELSTSYGTDLLLNGMIKDQRKAAKISTHLANNYSYHGYAIMEEEARGLGLTIIGRSDIIDLDQTEKIYKEVSFNKVLFFPAKEQAQEETQTINKKGGK